MTTSRSSQSRGLMQLAPGGPIQPVSPAPAEQLQAQLRYIAEVYGRVLGRQAQAIQAALEAVAWTMSASHGQRGELGDPTGDGPIAHVPGTCRGNGDCTC